MSGFPTGSRFARRGAPKLLRGACDLFSLWPRVSWTEEPREATSDMASSGGKTPILDLTKYLDRRVRVKFQGGREVEGALKGYDQLVNLVLDDTSESMRDPDDPFKASGATRKLGLVICRGVQVCLITPVDGTEEIANPFVAGDGGS